MSPKYTLPLAEVKPLPSGSGFGCRVTNGFRRFFTNRAAGYVSIPIIFTPRPGAFLAQGLMRAHARMQLDAFLQHSVTMAHAARSVVVA
ncbi:hypothetical protein C6Q10_32775 [Burkholderia multivorans]|nr:hypothetical protein C6Q10_32775 [Burkholderia multivorans]